MTHYRLLGLFVMVGCGQVMTSNQTPPVDGGETGDDAPSCPTCSDDSCAQLVWNFDDADFDGVTARSPSDLQLAIRDFNGSPALAIDTSALTEVSFTVPVCGSGLFDGHELTLSANVFFDGGTDTGVQYYVKASMPDPDTTGAALTQTGVASNTPTTYSVPLNMSALSTGTTSVTFQVGTFGAAFAGTIYFDDIQLD
jgi:hypothetical protein